MVAWLRVLFSMLFDGSLGLKLVAQRAPILLVSRSARFKATLLYSYVARLIHENLKSDRNYACSVSHSDLSAVTL
jgi:hypothetical protein